MPPVAKKRVYAGTLGTLPDGSVYSAETITAAESIETVMEESQPYKEPPQEQVTEVEELIAPIVEKFDSLFRRYIMKSVDRFLPAADPSRRAKKIQDIEERRKANRERLILKKSIQKGVATYISRAPKIVTDTVQYTTDLAQELYEYADDAIEDYIEEAVDEAIEGGGAGDLMKTAQNMQNASSQGRVVNL